MECALAKLRLVQLLIFEVDKQFGADPVLIRQFQVGSERLLSRRRFTIGHEIGHWCFRDDSVSFKDIHRDHPSDLERTVDAFSAELLMPAELVARDWSRTPNLQALARRFVVSRVAMRRRLYELGLVTPVENPEFEGRDDDTYG